MLKDNNDTPPKTGTTLQVDTPPPEPYRGSTGIPAPPGWHIIIAAPSRLAASLSTVSSAWRRFQETGTAEGPQAISGTSIKSFVTGRKG